MGMVSAAILIAAVIFTPEVIPQQYVLTSAEQRSTMVSLTGTAAQTFTSASQAAFAAAVRDGHLMFQNGEVGAKIYVDVRDGVREYTFGKLIPEQVDPTTSDEEITYDTSVTDGHLAVVGIWHRHPIGDSIASLWGHSDMISDTRQTVWTSVARDLYVQFWEDGRHAVSEPTLVCSGCLP